MIVFDFCLHRRPPRRRAARPPLRSSSARPPRAPRRSTRGARRRRRLRRADGGPRAAAQPGPRRPRDRVHRRRPAQARHAGAGLKVLGTTDEIGAILDRTEPDEVVIAIPSAPGVLRGKVVAACRERDIAVRTLPTVFELLRGGVQLTRQLREVQVEDVLGREPVRDGARPGRRLPRRQARPRHRRGRLDRRRALAPDRPRAPAAARPPRPRRGQPLPDRPGDDRASGTSAGSSRCSPTARRATGCSR